MRSPDVVRIGPDLLKQLRLLAFTSLMFSGGFACAVWLFGGMGWLLSSGWILVVCTAAVFILVFLLISAIRGRPYLEIGPDGFVTHSLFTSKSHCWADIQGEFAVIRFAWQKAVAYRLANPNQSQVERKPNAYLGEYDAVLGPYRLPAEELAVLLNERKKLNDTSGAPVNDTGGGSRVAGPATKAKFNESYPSWVGLLLAPPCGAIAGMIVARDTHDFTQAQGVIGGAAAGLLAGLIVWAIDLLRARVGKTQR